ncbi:MAG: hypothetical protein ACREBF_02680 [Candidatus Micrarchaeales archaeon]
MSEEDEISSDLGKKSKKGGHVSIALPMAIWIALLLLGLILQAYITLTNITTGTTFTILNGVSSFILKLPGVIILPIVFGAFVGAIVGLRTTGKIRAAAMAGLLNGVYACLVYIIAIVIIYLVLLYSLNGIQPTLLFLLEYWIAAPVVLVIALSVVFAVISSLRKLM